MVSSAPLAASLIAAVATARDLAGAELARPRHLRGDDVRHLLELVSGDRAVGQAPAGEVRERALLVDRHAARRGHNRRPAGASCSSRCRCRRAAPRLSLRTPASPPRASCRGGSRPGSRGTGTRRTRSAARCARSSRLPRTPARRRRARPRPPRRRGARSKAAPRSGRGTASGVELSAAREVGTNSIPRPIPIGISGSSVTGLWSGMPGTPSTSSPTAADRNPATAGSPLAVLVDQPARDRSGRSDQQRDHHQHRRGAERRETDGPLQVLLGQVEAADHDRERQRGDGGGDQDRAVQDRVAAVLAVDRRRQVADDPDRREHRQRHQRPPVRAPPERDRQHAAEQRSEQVRDARARAPDAERCSRAAPAGSR